MLLDMPSNLKAPYVSLHHATDDAPSLFTFSARSQAEGTFSFFKSSREEKLNRYMFNCTANSWYLDGVKDFAAGHDETLDRMRILLRSSSNPNSLFIGSSMGGYAATLFGAQCNARRVIAFGTEIITNLPCGYSRENLSHLTSASPYFHLDGFISQSHTLFDFIAGEFCPVDLFGAAAACQHANSRMHVIAGARHVAVKTIKDAGLLPSVVDAGLEHRPIIFPRELRVVPVIGDFLDGYAYQFDVQGYKKFLSDYSDFYVNHKPSIRVEDFFEVFTFLYKSGLFNEAGRILDIYIKRYGEDEHVLLRRMQILYRTKKYTEILALPNVETNGDAQYFKAASAARSGDSALAQHYLSHGFSIAESTKNSHLKKSLTDLQKNLCIPVTGT